MGTRLYVGNLSYHTTEDALRAAFSEGERQVVKVDILHDRETGQPRGFAFVEMGSQADAEATIRDWDGRDLDGRSLRVNEARERSDRGFGGGGGFDGGGGGRGRGGGFGGGRGGGWGETGGGGRNRW